MPTGPVPRPPGPAFRLSQALVRDGRLNPQERQVWALGRAVERDGRLNPQELARRDAVVHALEHPPAPRPPLPGPGEQVAAHRRPLERAGWRVEVFDHPLRGRLEAFHPRGATVMLTADRRRSGDPRTVIGYLLPPGARRWVRTDLDALAHFAVHLRLPPGAGCRRIATKCRCDKVRYPTLAAAAAALGTIAPTRTGHHHERRCYRCEADDRVWHLTSKFVGYVDPVPLADAPFRTPPPHEPPAG
jgi:hypothetical protein